MTKGVLLASFALLMGMGTASAMQSADDAYCASVQSVVWPDPTSQSVAVPAALRGDKATIACLAGMIRGLGDSLTSTALDETTRQKLVLVTGATRSILETDGDSAIQIFRESDDLGVIRTLTLAARSDDQYVRINATMILANTIDNTTVCVPIDHLYGPEIPKNPSGRMNLLGVVSVVAPWAYRENFENLARLEQYVRAQLGREADVEKTTDVLNNLKARLDYQSTLPESDENKNAPLPPGLRQCAAYTPAYANAAGTTNMSYSAETSPP